jgi:hypothetical protein
LTVSLHLTGCVQHHHMIGLGFPTETVPITSLVAQFLQEQGAGDMAEDRAGFDMTLLHYRRTFVEKMFALHGKLVRLQQDGSSSSTAPLDRLAERGLHGLVRLLPSARASASVSAARSAARRDSSP